MFRRKKTPPQEQYKVPACFCTPKVSHPRSRTEDECFTCEKTIYQLCEEYYEKIHSPRQKFKHMRFGDLVVDTYSIESMEINPLNQGELVIGMVSGDKHHICCVDQQIPKNYIDQYELALTVLTS